MEKEENAEGEDKEGSKSVDWGAVDVVGGCLKMGIDR